MLQDSIWESPRGPEVQTSKFRIHGGTHPQKTSLQQSVCRLEYIVRYAALRIQIDTIQFVSQTPSTRSILQMRNNTQIQMGSLTMRYITRILSRGIQIKMKRKTDSRRTKLPIVFLLQLLKALKQKRVYGFEYCKTEFEIELCTNDDVIAKFINLRKKWAKILVIIYRWNNGGGDPLRPLCNGGCK